MDAQAMPNLVHASSLRFRLALVLAALFTHSLALTIAVGLFVACHIAHLPQRILLWSLLTLGWVGAIILADWGLRWGFIRFVLSFIHSSRHARSHHSDISLESFSALPRSSQPSRASTPFERHLAHITPSMEPLCPETPLRLQDALHLRRETDDERMQTHPYHHAYDPTAPEPVYDPTALARYELERSWARLGITTDKGQGH
jgi:hypothetical protein